MVSIIQHYNLKKHNTFGIEAYAANYVEVHHIDELVEVILTICPLYPKHFILGGGSNILLTKNIEGLTIKNNISGWEIVEDNEETIELRVYAGTIWHDLVEYTVNKKYQGIENLALIPGTVGAAPIQNIGAYGVEVSNVVKNVHVVDLKNAAKKIVSNAECQFAYRDSIFKNIEKNNYFIYAIDLVLKKKNYTLQFDYGDIKKVLSENNIETPSIKNIFDAVIRIRTAKLPNPNELGNAGSFFKNPEVSQYIFENLATAYPNLPYYNLENGNYKIPAAWLIEQCGLKGKVIGNTGNHAKQALVIVNYGNATGKEILQHAEFVIQTVKDKFGIVLNPEVNIM